MFKSANYLLCSLAVLALQGSWAASQEKGQTVCLLSDPTNQCGQFCLRTLDPMQGQLASIEGKQDVMQTKLLAVQSRLEAQRTSLESQLGDQLLAGQAVIQSKLESQLLAMQSEIKALHTKTVDSILLAVQEKLDDHKAVVQESLKRMITKEDFEARVNETEGKIGAVQASLPALQHQLLVLQNQSRSQQEILLENLAQMNSKIVPPKFEQIGSRYFYIEQNLKQNWTTAAASCRQMGGYLAAFQNEQEFNAIAGHLLTHWYWLGFNDIDKEGEYVSVASGRPAPFLNWDQGQPEKSKAKSCVLVSIFGMMENACHNEFSFICQWDKEV